MKNKSLLAVSAIIFSFFAMSLASCSSVIYPQALQKGDKIAILSPAGPIDSTVVEKAAHVLDSLGYEPVIYPHTFGRNGHFSGTHDERYADMEAAFTDPDVRAILCSRGGYGVVHNLDRLTNLDFKKSPKWVIGFSDISALHALMASKGIASIHASMAKHVALGAEDQDNASLFSILRGEMPTYKFEAHEYNHLGTAEGKLLGGNLAVIADLINTPFDVIQPGTILFIEDVSEPIYKMERILYQLRLSGVMGKLKGLIIGQFTDYKADKVHETMEDMIREVVEPYNIPIAFNIPMGHVDHNTPFIESAKVRLDVAQDGVTLEFKR